MRIDDQLCTPKQARKLKKLGVDQKSQMYFVFDNDKIKFISENDTIFDDDLFIVQVDSYEWNEYPGYDSYPIKFSAFSVAELGIMLVGSGVELPSYNKNTRRWFCPAGIFAQIVQGKFPKKGHKTEAQSRAAILIYMIENDYVEIEYVNHRLKKKR